MAKSAKKPANKVAKKSGTKGKIVAKAKKTVKAKPVAKKAQAKSVKFSFVSV